MLDWLRRLWFKGGYTCDGCKKWTPRWKGKPKVVNERVNLPKGVWTPRAIYWVTNLYCPECVAWSKEGLDD